MKNVVRILIDVAAFGAGVAVGYFAKKRSEMKIEEVSEEEMRDIVKRDMRNAPQKPSEPQEAHSWVDVEEEINKIFKTKEEAIEAHEEGIGNGQKIAYFKKWKAEDYDTRTKEEPEDVVVSEEEDQEVPDGVPERDIFNLPEIEPATMADWYHWLGKQDGQYDPIELYWYDRDDVLTDAKEMVVERSEIFVGFDIGDIFNKEAPDDSKDDNVRILFNNRHGLIYHITRINGSWNLKKKAEEFGSEEDDNEEDDYERWTGKRL